MSVTCSGDQSGIFYTSPSRSGCIVDGIVTPLSARCLGSVDHKPLMSYEGNWVASKRLPGSGLENGLRRLYFPRNHVLCSSQLCVAYFGKSWCLRTRHLALFSSRSHIP